MKYPEERILIIRPCLKAICMGIKPAAKLLSLLLYYARNCREDEATFTLTCTQSDLLRDLIGEMDVKTLHNVAIPVLRLLGYVDVNGSSYRYEYIVDVALAQHAIDHSGDSKQLEKILIASIRQQLGKFPEQLEILPNELGKILIELEKFLIPFRKIPNSSRGRKPCSQVRLEPLSESPRWIENNKIDKITGDVGVFAERETPPASSSLQWIPDLLEDTTPLPADENHSQFSTPDMDEVDISDAPTVHRMPAIRIEKGCDDAPATPAAGNPALQPALAPDALSGEGCESRAGATTSAINASIPAASGVPADIPRVLPLSPALVGDGTPLSPTVFAPTPPVVGKKRPTKPKKDNPPLLCEPAKVKAVIVEFRGHTLSEAGAVIAENKIIKAWCQQFTEADLEYVQARLPKDEFWGKREKRKFFRAKHFVDLADALLAERARKQQAHTAPHRSTIEVPPDFGMDEPLSLVAAAVKRPTPHYVFD